MSEEWLESGLEDLVISFIQQGVGKSAKHQGGSEDCRYDRVCGGVCPETPGVSYQSLKKA